MVSQKHALLTLVTSVSVLAAIVFAYQVVGPSSGPLIETMNQIGQQDLVRNLLIINAFTFCPILLIVLGTQFVHKNRQLGSLLNVFAVIFLLLVLCLTAVA